MAESSEREREPLLLGLGLLEKIFFKVDWD